MRRRRATLGWCCFDDETTAAFSALAEALACRSCAEVEQRESVKQRNPARNPSGWRGELLPSSMISRVSRIPLLLALVATCAGSAFAADVLPASAWKRVKTYNMQTL